jgi:5-methylcytosine-specific restriction enzyme A
MSEFVPFPIGTLLRRAEIHDTFGGQEQGGVSTPSEHPVILLFTSEKGAEFGYLSDGFQDDGTFWYTGRRTDWQHDNDTGEGQIGNMTMTRGNAAIRDSSRGDKELHVFDTIKDGRRRYLGQFVYLGHHENLAPDKNGNQRRVIVFELESVSSSDPRIPTEVPGSRGVRRVEGANLFFREEMPDLIAEEATKLWNNKPSAG